MIPAVASVEALLADYDPRCHLLSATRPPSGLANSVLLVTTSREELVLKVYAGDAGRWKPQKERVVFDHMRALGIPAPQLLKVDTSVSVVPYGYSLLERRPGEPLSTVSALLSDAERMRIYVSLGDYVGRLHAATFDLFGDVAGSAGELRVTPIHEWADLDMGPFSTWAALHAATVRARLRFLEGTVFADLMPAARRFLEARGELIDYPIVPRLLHMDLHPGNVLIDDGKVSAVLDVEEAVVGHNEYDLMRTELANFRGQPPAFAHAFMQAYTSHVPLDEGFETRKDFYDVSRTLVWMKSIILNSKNGATARTSSSHDAAREHLLALIGRG